MSCLASSILRPCRCQRLPKPRLKEARRPQSQPPSELCSDECERCSLLVSCQLGSTKFFRRSSFEQFRRSSFWPKFWGSKLLGDHQSCPVDSVRSRCGIVAGWCNLGCAKLLRRSSSSSCQCCSSRSSHRVVNLFSSNTFGPFKSPCRECNQTGLAQVCGGTPWLVSKHFCTCRKSSPG